MCNFEDGFMLCSCQDKEKPVVHQKNSRRHKHQPQAPLTYRWALARFAGTYEALMEGIYELPAKDLGQGLTEEWVLLHLNYAHCFDFDYTPAEGDNLVMSGEKPFQHMSFLFQKGIWEAGRYDGFSTILEKFQEGKMDPLP